MKQFTFFKKYRTVILLAGILLLTILIYANSIGNDFINWDDPENIINNKTIHEISLKNFITWFTTDLRLMYTPLVSLSYALDYQIGKLNPSVYHCTNLLLHLCNIILIFWIFQALIKKPLISLAVAALFAVHPVNVDGISWISTRSSLLCTLFFAAALIFYVYYLKSNSPLFSLDIKFQKRLNGKELIADIKSVFAHHCFTLAAENSVAVRHPGREWVVYAGAKRVQCIIKKEENKLNVYWGAGIAYLFLSALFFLCAVLSKSSAVVLPVVLLLFDYFAGRKLTLKLFLEKIPFGIISLFIGLLTLMFRADQGFTDVPLNYNLPDRFFVVCSSFTAYLFKLLFPLRLSYSYSFPEKSGAFLPLFYYFTPMILGLVVFAFFKLKVPKKILIFGFLFFFFNAILSQAVLLLDNYQSNRYAYLSYVGLFLILAALFEKGLGYREGWQAKLKFLWIGMAVVFMSMFCVLTVQRNALWKNSITILDDLLAKEPKTVWAYNSRGMAKMDKQDFAGAVRDFDRSEALNPDYYMSYFYRAIARQQLKDYSGAIADYDRVIAYAPTYSRAFNNRALVRVDQGDYQGALEDLSHAIQLRPEYSTAFYYRALVKSLLQDAAGACADARRAQELGFIDAEQLVKEQCE